MYLVTVEYLFLFSFPGCFPQAAAFLMFWVVAVAPAVLLCELLHWQNPWLRPQGFVGTLIDYYFLFLCVGWGFQVYQRGLHYNENNGSESSLLMYFFFLSFKGCFRGTKTRANSFLFLYSELIPFMYLSKEVQWRNAVRWFCMAAGWSGPLLSGLEWFSIRSSLTSSSVRMSWSTTLILHLPKHCLSPSDSTCASAHPSLCHKLCPLADGSLSLGLFGCLAVGWLQFWLSSTPSLGRSWAMKRSGTLKFTGLKDGGSLLCCPALTRWVRSGLLTCLVC